jgi:membrane protein YdbS with pleckstrin-like domain
LQWQQKNGRICYNGGKGGKAMKNVGLLVWFTQLGISVAVPLIGAVGLSVWLYNRYNTGVWVIVLGVAAGLYGAVDGLRMSLRAMKQMAEQENEEKLD